ncbi:MAG: sensor histidine kinase efflux regulator BaeS [Burkholderiales bacterium]|nr:sensor histidine kinase efflux regulator BaeS [Burkholderiales bacterium]
MKLSIPTKLFLAVLTACALVLVVNGIAGRLSFERAFLGYLNEQGVQRMQEIAVRLASEYRRHGNWEFLRGKPEVWFQLVRPRTMNTDGKWDQPPPLSDQTGVILRLALFDEQDQRLLGNPAAAAEGTIRRQVTVDDRTVGWLAMVPLEKAVDEGDVRFYQAQQRAWWINIAASVVVAALLAWVLSRALLGRLQMLTGGIHKLAAGDYTTRIVSRTDDELGRLVQDLNRLANVLERTEQSRRDFMADISHELRTPLAVLRAELEAIQDGIRPLHPDSLAPLQGQVQQLGELIDDLHELSMTQAEPSYQFAPIDVGAALDAALASMARRFADAGLELHADLSPTPLLVQGEERRLQQLFANLLENATRYTDRGGQVHASVQQDRGHAVIVIEDSAPGVPDDKRARLFERFYRVETSRSRASGGSGLGLTICRHIVQAHRGEIRAEASSLGGLRIVIAFPLLP